MSAPTMPRLPGSAPRPRGIARVPAALGALLCLMVASGCYTFQPTTLTELAPGQDVRIRVTGSYADTLGPILLTDDARVVEGSVVELPPPSLLLEVAVSNELQGMRFQTLAQRVALPTDEIVEVESKELSRGRTYGAIGVIAAVAAAIVIDQLSGRSGGGSIPGGGGPVESVVESPGLSVVTGFLNSLIGR